MKPNVALLDDTEFLELLPYSILLGLIKQLENEVLLTILYTVYIS